VAGYVLSALVTGFIVGVITLVLGEVYIVSNGGKWLDIFSFIEVIGALIITSVMITVYCLYLYLSFPLLFIFCC